MLAQSQVGVQHKNKGQALAPDAAFIRYLAGMGLHDALRPVGDCPTADHVRGWWAANRAASSASMPAVLQ